MKVIGLMIAYNELHYLRYSLPILSSLVDVVCILDKSNDGSKDYYNEFNNLIIYHEEEHPELVSLLSKREFIYNMGIQNGGTHFFFIDADEIISSELSKNFRGIISNMNRGDLIAFHWYNIMNKDFNYVIYDVFPYFPMLIYPTTLHRYKEDHTIVNSHAHENRLPTIHGLGWDNCRIIRCDYPVLHFGRFDSNYMEWKQVQSMIGEYIHGRDIGYINLFYTSHDILYKLETMKLNMELIPNNIDSNIFRRSKKVAEYNAPILELINKENIPNEVLYKLDIFRNKDLINFFSNNVSGFDVSCIKYKKINVYSKIHKIHLYIDSFIEDPKRFIKRVIKLCLK